jgi:hypothetical protein
MFQNGTPGPSDLPPRGLPPIAKGSRREVAAQKSGNFQEKFTSRLQSEILEWIDFIGFSVELKGRFELPTQPMALAQEQHIYSLAADRNGLAARNWQHLTQRQGTLSAMQLLLTLTGL